MDPADLTLDLLDADPWAAVAALRSSRPVAWVPSLGGWMITGRDLAVTVMRDATTFTVDDPRFSTAQVVGPSMLSLDGAEHTRHRAPFVDALRPAEVAQRYTERIDQLAVDLVQRLRPAGTAELRTELAAPLAVDVAAEVLGLDTLDHDELLGHYRTIVAAVDDVSRGLPVPAEGTAAFELLADAVRRAAQDRATLVGEVARSLSIDEVVSNSAVFLFGGIETSEGMTANVLHHLLSTPDAWTSVLADAARVDNAVEESLRLEPAASRVDRYATVDVDLAGAHVRAGDLVVVSLTAANRDPSVFLRPDEFDVRRDNARMHVAFATGPHACIGAQLARMETRAAVRAVRALLPGVTLQTPNPPRGVIFRKSPSVRVSWH